MASLREMSSQERQLCHFLLELPKHFEHRYNDGAQNDLLKSLFWSMARGQRQYLELFFPPGTEPPMKLSDAQGNVEGTEYTEGARGKRCGHIFKSGEATFNCRTCSADDTCVLCNRCFDSTDHKGHMVRINISVGNSGCCDCGDEEAWLIPMNCTIHSEKVGGKFVGAGGKGKGLSTVPDVVVEAISMTVGRVLDFICDVVSCSPEQLRQTKTKESILQDEQNSRLSEESYGIPEELNPNAEFSLVLWNDEKHTLGDVQSHVARSCRTTEADGLKRARETDSIGRSILTTSREIPQLLEMAAKLEEIRVTITIRSARDTFREQMCATMIDWLSDISKCSVGNSYSLLREIVCQEMLQPWRQGSPASHKIIGKDGISDEERIANEQDRDRYFQRQMLRNFQQLAAQQAGFPQMNMQAEVAQQGAELLDRLRQDVLMVEDIVTDDDDDDDLEDMIDLAGGNTPPADEDDDDDDEGDDDEDVIMEDLAPVATGAGGTPRAIMNPMRAFDEMPIEDDEATMAGFPPQPPPPPPATTTTTWGAREASPSDSDAAPETLVAPLVLNKANADIPKTPGKKAVKSSTTRTTRYWLETPAGYRSREKVSPAEDVFRRVRLDWLILFDLRLWKKVRKDLRSLYISTVVVAPHFKRILSLRFASLYTILAQLYLIGDREPDHSIINLSLQMFTTPSITAELVERGNFLTCLLAILYTFLTTRQVGHPWDVVPSANLAFDSGSVTNRRMYHFYMDLKYLFNSPHVQDKIRSEERYLMQFLDLVKLHQGIGPNVRAIKDHVEYETDSWITASLVTREINRMSRQLSDAFKSCSADRHMLSRAIRLTAKTVLLHSIGAERNRFKMSEIKDEVRFKTLHDFEFDEPSGGDMGGSGDDAASRHRVIMFAVESDPISFHHALHYTLSWLIERARSYSAAELRSLLSFTAQELYARPRSMGGKLRTRHDYSAEDYMMAAFDYPLRVCAWLAQIKANMWVRNGISLRHQAATYRGVNQRDVSHHRDIFLLQTAMVTCNPSRVLTSIVDRFGMVNWVKGIFEHKTESIDDVQHLDVAEDMIHLLIVLLSDRTSLIAPEDDPNPTLLAMRRDLIHVLCFKTLSFNEICNKMPDRYESQEDFHQVLETISTFKAPESVSDVGTFELKAECMEEIDPYIAHYNKNQREESETAYRKKMALKTGLNADDIVYEPKLRPIPSGVFKALADFTGSGMFAQIIYYSLLYPLVAGKLTPAVPFTRVETFLQVILHLILIAIAEDQTDDDDMTEESLSSFVYMALKKTGRHNFMPDPLAKTIVSLLNKMSNKEEFKACHKKIALILKRMKQKRPMTFEQACCTLGIEVDRINTASPAVNPADEELAKKKRAASTRQRILEQMQKQQKSFMENQKSIDWGVDVDDDDENDAGAGGSGGAAGSGGAGEDRTHNWKYPGGTCILCQEETDERRLYGTFGLLYESRILRQTDLQDADFVREAFQTPTSLDRPADDIRPFGLARENRRMVMKMNRHGESFEEEHQTIGKGFPARLCMAGPVLVGCGHIMHYSCFKTYVSATQRRHHSQIARHHPENLDRNEFVCPLCKALGNCFLPIVWKGKKESYPGCLQPQMAFGAMLDDEVARRFEYDTSLTPAQARLQMHHHHSKAMGLDEGWFGADASSSLTPVTRITTVGSGQATHSVAVHESNIRESSGIGGLGSGAQGSIAKELIEVYRRLRDTLRINELKSRHAGLQHDMPASGRGASPDQLHSSDVLVQAVAYTISTVELAQRGVGAGFGMTFIDKIPEIQLTHLRILAESVSSYISVGSLRSSGTTPVGASTSAAAAAAAADNNRILQEVAADANQQHCKLFVSQYVDGDTQHIPMEACEVLPLLSHDVFMFLVECDFGLREVRSGGAPSLGGSRLDIISLVRLCYLAELVKVVYYMSQNIPASVWLRDILAEDSDNRELSTFAAFAFWITRCTLECHERAPVFRSPGPNGPNEAFLQPGLDHPAGWMAFAKKYALVFLRKCALLLHARHGVDFAAAHVLAAAAAASSSSPLQPPPPSLPLMDDDDDKDELDRLSEAMRLPSFAEMCAALTDVGGTFGWPESVKTLADGWIRHEVQHYGWGRHVARVVANTSSGSNNNINNQRGSISGTSLGSGVGGAAVTTQTPTSSSSMSMTSNSPALAAAAAATAASTAPKQVLAHPGIFELVGLPKNYDALIDEATRGRCPNSGRDLSDPMLCLLCGEIFCGQSVCCLLEERTGRHQEKDSIGGAQQHMRYRCHGNVGLFLNIRKCATFYLFRRSGSFGPAPYIDQYGETDMGLRHSRPLFLHQRRYDSMLRQTFLGSGIPSYISRKLEGEINNGGWETI